MKQSSSSKTTTTSALVLSGTSHLSKHPSAFWARVRQNLCVAWLLFLRSPCSLRTKIFWIHTYAGDLQHRWSFCQGGTPVIMVLLSFSRHIATNLSTFLSIPEILWYLSILLTLATGFLYNPTLKIGTGQYQIPLPTRIAD